MKTMKRRAATILILAVGLVLARAAAPEPAVIRAAEGWVIFDPTKDGYAYRYGPSLIINPDGSMDAWFASPGGKGEDGKDQWDWIRHKQSADGGKTWGAETVVLKATAGSRDRQSVCDPGVIKLDGWYYLGVTSVEDPKGMCNEVFVARSKSPVGPFEKWNGRGWGGAPQPLLPFRKPADVWGLGEPSFVRKGATIFIYYTVISRDPAGQPINRTRVATAPANDPNWPAKMMPCGTAFEREEGEDSADVKFVDAFNAFVAVSTAKRFTTNSCLNVRWSLDGFAFSSPAHLTDNIKTRCHNVGISGTPEGHLDLNQKNCIAYAFSDGSRPGTSWAFWHTFLNPITFAAVNPRADAAQAQPTGGEPEKTKGSGEKIAPENK